MPETDAGSYLILGFGPGKPVAARTWALFCNPASRAIKLALRAACGPLLSVRLLIDSELRKAAIYGTCFHLRRPQRDLSIKPRRVVIGEQARLNSI